MSNIQQRLKAIQQDKSKDDEEYTQEDMEVMLNMAIKKPYLDRTKYYPPKLLSQIIPECYKSIQFDENKFEHYSEETLFYIFYAFSSDEVQKNAYKTLIKHGYHYSKFYRCFVKLEDQKMLDNKKHHVTMFDPFIWSKVSRDVVYDDKFIYTLEK